MHSFVQLQCTALNNCVPPNEEVTTTAMNVAKEWGGDLVMSLQLILLGALVTSWNGEPSDGDSFHIQAGTWLWRCIFACSMGLDVQLLE